MWIAGVGADQTVSHTEIIRAAWRGLQWLPTAVLKISVQGRLEPPQALDSMLIPLLLVYSVTESAKALGDHVKMDLFQPARLDKTHSVEEVVQTLKEMVDEGLFSYIGLSEVGAETLRRASKVSLCMLRC